MMTCRRAPAASRNRAPILEVLRKYLPESGTVLEIASGTGEHVSYFAAAMPHLNWQPTDIDPAALSSTTAYCEDADLGEPGDAATSRRDFVKLALRTGRRCYLCQYDPYRPVAVLRRFGPRCGIGLGRPRTPSIIRSVQGNGVHTAPTNDASIKR